MSPLMVGLLSVASSFPYLILSLPAGALADMADRRRLLLFAHGWMLAAAALLGSLTLLVGMTAWGLLAFTFLLGLGSALNLPAWVAIDSEILPLSEIPKSAALDNVGFNLTRAVGPALGGMIVAKAGAGIAFLINAISFLGIIVVLFRWRRAPVQSAIAEDGLISTIMKGIRHVWQAPGLVSLLVRMGLFAFGASGLWTLLPCVWRMEIYGGPLGYGMLLGCLGAGAVLAAIILPWAGVRISFESIAVSATVLFAAATLILAFVRLVPMVFLGMVGGGFAWLALMSSFNSSALSTTPSWVLARVLAMYLLVLSGASSMGSALWGAIANYWSLHHALGFSAMTVILSIPAGLLYPLQLPEAPE